MLPNMTEITLVHHMFNVTVNEIIPIIAQATTSLHSAPVPIPAVVAPVVQTLQPDSAPLWLDVFIWMALFWQWIMVGFIPAFYVAVAKLFGMPLLQRWSQEVVIMLYPTKVEFKKIKEQYDPYVACRKGVYWLDNPINPEVYQEMPEKIKLRLEKMKERYEELANPENKTLNKKALMDKILKEQAKLEKQITVVDPRNQIHIFTHAINQEITNSERRETKVDEILHNNTNPKQLKGHGVWLLQNPMLHFHRHWVLYISPDSKTYQLVPVKKRQQFGIGFWHSLGIVKTAIEEVEEEIKDDLGHATGNTQKRQMLVETVLTTNVIMQQIDVIQDYQNFSASRAYMLLKKRAEIENKYNGFSAMIAGIFDARILFLIAGMVGLIGVIYLLLGGHGSPPTGTPAPAGVVHIL